MRQWDKVFAKHGKVFLKVHESMPEIVRLLKKRGAKKVLDLGCGSGRHTVYLAKKGFTIYGFDIAKSGIEVAKKWLKSHNLKANFKTGSIYSRWPYPQNYFDAIISINVLQHAHLPDIRKAIKEARRVLQPGGFLFATLRRRRISQSWRRNHIIEKYGYQKVSYKVIAPRTYAPTEGWEKDLPHYLFNKKILRWEFRNFKIEKIGADRERRHYNLLAFKK